MEINNKLKINEYVSIAQLKRKLKAYLAEQGNSDFKPSIFAQGLIVSLVMVLEELVADCLKSISKEKSGLYTINQMILTNLFCSSDKYNFASKYMKKYSSTLRYHESIFFNFNKVIANLEDKHGSKLMVESEAKNTIAYIILSLQYDIVELSVSMVKYAGRKMLNTNVLDIVCSYIISNDISNKIKLKLDSINISNTDDSEDTEDKDDNLDEVENVENTGDETTPEQELESISVVELKTIPVVEPESVPVVESESVPVVEQELMLETSKDKKKKSKESKESKDNDENLKNTISNKIVKENEINKEIEKSEKSEKKTKKSKSN